MPRQRFSPANFRHLDIPARRLLARQDLVRVARLVGRPEGVGPTPAEYDRHGRFSRAAVRRLLGLPTKTRPNPFDNLTCWARGNGWLATEEAPWSAVVARAGLQTSKAARKAGTTEAMKADVVRVANLMGRWPTTKEYEEHGKFFWTTVHKKFGGWNRLAQTLGYRVTPNASRSGIYTHTEEELTLALRKWCKDNGFGAPFKGNPGPGKARFGSWADGRPRSGHGQLPVSADTYVRRFRGWNTALALAGYEPSVLGKGRRKTDLTKESMAA